MKVSELYPKKPAPVSDDYPFSRKHTSQVSEAEALGITMREGSYGDSLRCYYCGRRCRRAYPQICDACNGD